MRKLLDTHFYICEKCFIIHHNNKRSEYEGKYKLMMFNDNFGSWMLKGTDNSMKQLKNYAEENALYW